MPSESVRDLGHRIGQGSLESVYASPVSQRTYRSAARVLQAVAAPAEAATATLRAAGRP